MIETIRLRPAKPGDARAIGRIHVETWRAAYPGMVPDQTLIGMTVDGKAAAWRRALERGAKREITLIAEAEEGPVGFASAGPNRDSMLPFAGEVQTLYVLPDWQNQGIGRLLLQGCFARLRNHRDRLGGDLGAGREPRAVLLRAHGRQAGGRARRAALGRAAA